MVTDKAKPVVVGVDGTDTAMNAARWAAAVAQKFTAPLLIANGTSSDRHLPWAVGEAVRAAVVAEQRESAEIMIKSVEEAVRAEFPTLNVITIKTDETAGKMLTDLSRNASLVVLGCDRLSPASALLVGSTNIALATHSSCPVVAWRGTITVPTEQPVVVGVGMDGARTDAAGFTAAFEFADRFGVELHAVHAWPAMRPPGAVTIPYLIDWEALETAQWQWLLETLAPWSERYPDVAVKYFVEPHGASRALLHRLTDSQLVVLGGRNRSLVAHALLGSTYLNLLHHSHVPVMLCRTSSDDQ